MANEDEAANGKGRSPSSETQFDFARHRRIAVNDYAEVREFYGECAQAVRSVLKVALEVEQIRVQSVDARGKTLKSFGDKAATPDEDDANKPKYVDPLNEITDLAGVRIIVFLNDHIQDAATLVEREFQVHKREEVEHDSGYRGLHLLVAFKGNRDGLPEYRRYKGRTTEIQIRTVLQHAWAEIEHGVGYKPTALVPPVIHQQLRDLAGALGTADRGLQDVVSQVERERLAGEGASKLASAKDGLAEPA